jgi:hypothetical protein
LRPAIKSELLKCFKEEEEEVYEDELGIDVPNNDKESTEACDGNLPVDITAVFLDGPAIVQMIKPGTNVTFTDYRNTFIKYVTNQQGNRVDVVFDVYSDESLKNCTREKRGTGVRQRVTPAGKLPRNWQKFLRLSDNKVELFNFLADGLQKVQHVKKNFSH